MMQEDSLNENQSFEDCAQGQEAQPNADSTAIAQDSGNVSDGDETSGGIASDLSELELEGAIEAMLFVTDDPVSEIALAKILEREVSEVEAALMSISERLKSSASGIQLREVAGGWRLCTHPAYHDIIEKYVISWDTRKLSAAALETLAIVAYTQPCTRNSVASIRGVSSDSSINSLIEKGLVREMGTSDAQGNPTLYGTTRTFLEKFGLRSVDDLADLADFAPDETTCRLIADRLSSTKQDVAVTQEQISEAVAQVAGVVEKVDFDMLEFDFDQE